MKENGVIIAKMDLCVHIKVNNIKVHKRLLRVFKANEVSINTHIWVTSTTLKQLKKFEKCICIFMRISRLVTDGRLVWREKERWGDGQGVGRWGGDGWVF